MTSSPLFTWTIIAMADALASLLVSLVVGAVQLRRHMSSTKARQPALLFATLLDPLVHIISTAALLPLVVITSRQQPVPVSPMVTPVSSFLTTSVVLVQPFYVAGAASSALVGSTKVATPAMRPLHWLPLATCSIALALAILLPWSAIAGYTARHIALVVLLFTALVFNTACLASLFALVQWSRLRRKSVACSIQPHEGEERKCQISTSLPDITTLSLSFNSMLFTPHRFQAAQDDIEMMLQQARRTDVAVNEPPSRQASDSTASQHHTITAPTPHSSSARTTPCRDLTLGETSPECDDQRPAHDPFGVLCALDLASRAGRELESESAAKEASLRLCLALISAWISVGTAVPWLLYPLVAGRSKGSTPLALPQLFFFGASTSGELVSCAF